jgi:hypothetical protein
MQLLEDGPGGKESGEAGPDDTMRGPGVVTDLKEA